MSPPQPVLSHMPPEIKQTILNNLDDLELLETIGLVSTEFREHAAITPMHWQCLEIRLHLRKVTVTVELNDKKLEMEFRDHEKGVLKRNPASHWERILEGVDYRKAAIQYALAFFNHRETTVNTLKLSLDSGWRGDDEEEDPEDDRFPATYPKQNFQEDRQIMFEEINTTLREFNFPPVVMEICFEFEITDSCISGFRYLKPGTLTSIHINHEFPIPELVPTLTMELIRDLDIWKGLKVLNVDYVYQLDIPFDKWSRFDEVVFTWECPTVPTIEIARNFVNRPTFKELGIKSYEEFDNTGLDEYLENFDRETFFFVPPSPYANSQCMFLRRL